MPLQKHVPDHFLLQYDLILNSALSFSFLCCSFVWACRSCNVAAHTAAKLALSRQLHLYVSVRRIYLRLSSLLVSLVWQTPSIQFLLFLLNDTDAQQRKNKKMSSFFFFQNTKYFFNTYRERGEGFFFFKFTVLYIQKGITFGYTGQTLNSFNKKMSQFNIFFKRRVSLHLVEYLIIL